MHKTKANETKVWFNGFYSIRPENGSDLYYTAPGARTGAYVST